MAQEFNKMESLTINIIHKEDNLAIEKVIKNVFHEHGINRPGTAYFDPCLQKMYEHHTGNGMIYFVAKKGNDVIGGAGIYPTDGLPPDTCELVKMYLLKESRGLGIGRKLIEKCILFARENNYRQIYLETTPELNAAIKMYEKFGFLPIQERMGNTGHHSCGIFMLKQL